MFDEAYTDILPFQKRLARFLRYLNFKIWLFIFLVSVLAGINGFIADTLGGKLFSFRVTLVKSMDNLFSQFFFFFLLMCLMVITASYLCEKFSREAEGSGVPELKTYLSGLKITQYVSFKSYIVKMVGLILVDGSGIFTGKEGPLIQLSVMIANFVSDIPYVSKIKKTSFLRNQMLIVSIAAGVTSTFGSCYGGLMFSIEICTTIFLIANLWRAFVCSVIVKFIHVSLNTKNPLLRFVDLGKFQMAEYSILVHSVIIGIICGWLGSLWIYLFSKLQKFKKVYPIFQNRYIWCPIISLAISLLTFPLPSSYMGGKALLGNLFYERELQDGKYGFSDRTDLFFSLIFFTAICR